MSKLLTEPKTGYVKPKDGASSGVYPKTLVDAVYNEEKGESLSETLKTLESQGGGGGGSLVEINADWSKFASVGFACSSKEEALSSLGISEELFDAILDGSYENAYMKNTFSWTKGAHDETIINYFKPFRYVGSDLTISNGAETGKIVVKFMLWDVEADGRAIRPMSYYNYGSYGSYFYPTYKDEYPETRLVGFGFFTQWHQRNKTTEEDEVLENVYVIFGFCDSEE